MYKAVVIGDHTFRGYIKRDPEDTGTSVQTETKNRVGGTFQGTKGPKKNIQSSLANTLSVQGKKNTWL